MKNDVLYDFDLKDESIKNLYKNMFEQSNYKITDKFSKCINNINNKLITKRNPGIDLLRILAMYGIIIHHLLFLHNKGGFSKFSKYKKYLKLMHIFIFWHNNGFALISGMVGFKSFHYSNLLFLWFIVLFYSVGIDLYFKIFIKYPIIKYDFSKDFFPIIFKRYWYFTAYFGMYLFLPVINKGISHLNKYEFSLVVITILCLLVFWRDLKNPNSDVFEFKNGFSLIWLLTFYLTGAYIGKYGIVQYFGFEKYLYCFICIVIYLLLNILFFLVYNNKLHFGNKFIQKEIFYLLKNQMLPEKYDSIFKIVQSITITLFCLQINYHKLLAKIICFEGPLIFGIYLIHNNYLVKHNILIHSFDNTPENISLNSATIMILMQALKIFIICLIIEYFRNLIFKILKIKNLCIKLEIKMNKIFNHNL